MLAAVEIVIFLHQEKLKSFADAIAGIEAQMLYRFDSMEGKIAALQHITPVSTPLPVEESCLAMSSFINSCDAYGRIYH